MFCQNCGTQYGGGTCPNCGMVQQPVQPQVPPPVYNNNNGVKCPKCGSFNLQAISDVQGKGASFWKLCFCGLLGLCGTGKTKTTHYWVCGNCGNKFKI